MSTSVLEVRLFGRFCVVRRDQLVHGLEAKKLQELFSYLLLHRDRPHPRESLSSVLWADASTAQAQKYLRQALWQLQSALHGEAGLDPAQVLTVEQEWIRLNVADKLWLDVATFEKTCALLRGIPGRYLDADQGRALKVAVELYRGDLVEGWYQDWCLFERERLQNQWLVMLDKLMAHCEAQREYEAGVDYGDRILRTDPARERTHRRLMRLHYLAGDRVAALRQFDRCACVLRREFEVDPAERTINLRDQIRADHLAGATPTRGDAHAVSETVPGPVSDLLRRLEGLRAALADIERRVEEQIEAVQLTVTR